jgi:curved DNA-binding protein CbpA
MLKRPSEQDYYQVLEVDYCATPEEIQTAYESALEIYGGDSLVSTSILTEEERRKILRRVKDAYNTLIAEESRRLYDATLAISRGDVSGEEAYEKTEEAEVTDPNQRVEASSPTDFPRLIKGAQVSEAPEPRSTLRLGIKEEASGDFLRRARESAGMDLRSISVETKIGVTMLTYIEEERLEMLPAPIYLKNFVSQYAHCLGLDQEKVARSFLARIRRLESEKKKEG